MTSSDVILSMLNLLLMLSIFCEIPAFSTILLLGSVALSGDKLGQYPVAWLELDRVPIEFLLMSIVCPATLVHNIHC